LHVVIPVPLISLLATGLRRSGSHHHGAIAGASSSPLSTHAEKFVLWNPSSKLLTLNHSCERRHHSIMCPEFKVSNEICHACPAMHCLERRTAPKINITRVYDVLKSVMRHGPTGARAARSWGSVAESAPNVSSDAPTSRS
jgi:hypothetical protein